jgi:hypothetical protein
VSICILDEIRYLSIHCFCRRESHVSKIYISIEPHQIPIIYREEYNVHFGGIEKLHPFDAAKWGHIFQVGNILLFECSQDRTVCSGMYVFLFLLVNKQVTFREQAISAKTDTSPNAQSL